MGFNPFSAAGSPSNIDTSYERLGFLSTGGGTLITPSATINTKAASYTHLPGEGTAGVTANALAGFWVFAQASSAGSVRFRIDIAVGDVSSEVIIVPDLFVIPGNLSSAVGQALAFIPINIAEGVRVSARCQAGVSSSAGLKVALLGEVRTVNHPPLWTASEVVSTTPTGTPTPTLPSQTDIAGVSSPNTGWTTIADPTTRTYGALLAILGGQVSVVNAATTQELSFRLGTGGSGAADATWFWGQPYMAFAGAPSIPRFPGLLIRKTIPSGTRLAGEVLLATTDVNNTFSPYVLGFY